MSSPRGLSIILLQSQEPRLAAVKIKKNVYFFMFREKLGERERERERERVGFCIMQTFFHMCPVCGDSRSAAGAAAAAAAAGGAAAPRAIVRFKNANG